MPLLLGRCAEQEAIERLLQRARQGTSGVLVLRGPAGIGKSALLEYAIRSAAGMEVVRLRAVESDSEVAYAGLYDLCRRLPSALDRLTPPHSAILTNALVFDRHGPAVDRFTAGVAALGLLAAAAEDAPVLLVVDDAHWLDASSQEAIAFAARRLAAERVGVLFATRHAASGLAGLDEIVVGPLDDAAAAHLLRTASPVPLAEPVVDRLLTAAAGHPLALVELPALLSPEQAAGRSPLPDPISVGPSIEGIFGSRIDELPDAARRALVVVAAAGNDEGSSLVTALRQLGLDLAALEPAEHAGIVDVDVDVDGVGVGFRHPLLRSAVYHAATASERRAAHRALAAASSSPADTERRAWHLAGAAPSPDEEVAGLLEVTADRARERGAMSTAAAAYQAAARLSPTADDARRRRHSSAEAAFMAGDLDRCSRLLEGCPGDDEPVERGRHQHLQGRMMAVSGSPEEAARLLTDSADAVADEDPARATRMLLDAIPPVMRAGRPAEALDLARRARRVAEGDGELLALADVALGAALTLNGDRVAGRPLIARSHDVLHGGGRAVAELAPVMIEAAIALRWAQERDAARDLLQAVVGAARHAAVVSVLPLALTALAESEFYAQRYTTAWLAMSEAVSLAEATGQSTVRRRALMQLAWLTGIHGRLDEAERYAREVLAGADEADRTTRLRAQHGLGILGLWRDDLEAAIEWFERTAEGFRGLTGFDPVVGVWEQDLVEAYVRAGRTEAAREVLSTLEERQAANGLPIGERLVARCHGLLAEDAEIDGYFERACDGEPSKLMTSRTKLCWGWRLARAGRVDDARQRFEDAVVDAEAIGAVVMADRARAELARLSGAADSAASTAPATSAAATRLLTPDEFRAALLVGTGTSVEDASATLLLAPSSIERLLASACEKVEVRSLDELVADLLPSVAPPAEPGWSIRVLGGFSVRHAGRTVDMPTGLPTAALKAVITAGGRLHTEELVEALWPEAPDGAGRARLRNVLSRLRSACGDILVRTGDVLALADDVDLDLARFEELARAASDAGDDRSRLDAAIAAIAVYGGPLLPYDLYEPWVAAPRERLRRRYVDVLDGAAAAAARLGDVTEAVRRIQEAIEFDPLEEQRYVTAAELLRGEGRIAGARAMLARARGVLAELHIEPSDRLTAMERELRA